MKYVLDANVFIEAYRRYYAFDIAPCFWVEIKRQFELGTLICIDNVKNEILRKGREKDSLAVWFKDNIKETFPTSDSEITSIYIQIINWVFSCKNRGGELRFKKLDRDHFARGADPFIIAFAKARGYTVVTQEVLSIESRKPKIPNVCKQFSVPYVGTFEMLRKLGVQFK